MTNMGEQENTSGPLSVIFIQFRLAPGTYSAVATCKLLEKDDAVHDFGYILDMVKSFLGDVEIQPPAARLPLSFRC